MSDHLSPALRAFWLMTLASGLALAVQGATLLHMQWHLASADDDATALATHAQPVRAERALAEWGRPWLETFLRHRGLDVQLSGALAPCQADMLFRLDSLSLSQNRVLQTPIHQAETTAATCASSALGAELASSFARDLRARWDLWASTEPPVPGRGGLPVSPP